MIRSILQKILKCFDGVNHFCSMRVESYGAQYTVFGIFALLNYIVPYFMWSPSGSADYHLILILRIVAGLLCFLLVMKDYWPDKLVKYLPLYWHFTLMYCLPFLTTYMLVSSAGSLPWLSNMILALFLLSILVDWLSFCLILPLGIGLGCLATFVLQGVKIFSIDQATLFWAIYMYVFAALIGIIFSRNKEKTEQAKVKTINALGGAIAHEMRTPLLAIDAYSRGVLRYLPSLIKGYNKAKDAHLLTEGDTVSPRKIEALGNGLQGLKETSRRMFSIIDILLIKIKQNPSKNNPLEDCLIHECIEQSLKKYPFEEGDKALIYWNKGDDFQFKGNSLLVQHVIFNLFKNAIHYVKKAGKQGGIYISTEICPRHYNILRFRDEGTGIAPFELSQIFNRFYSTTRHGTGIGLYFCKMVMNDIGGEIACHSVEGQFTEFVLYFPKYLDNKKAKAVKKLEVIEV